MKDEARKRGHISWGECVLYTSSCAARRMSGSIHWNQLRMLAGRQQRKAKSVGTQFLIFYATSWKPHAT